MKNKKMNRRGDIPITILVIGVFAICGLAIFSFYVSNERTKSSFIGVELIEKINGFSDEILFYGNLQKDYSQEMEIFNGEIVIGNFIQNMTFKGEGNYIEGTLMQDGEKILWVKKRIG